MPFGTIVPGWLAALGSGTGGLVPLLPISGRSDPTIDHGLMTQFFVLEGLLRGKFAFVGDVLRHMIMPAFAIGLPLAAVIGRVLGTLAKLPCAAAVFVALAVAAFVR